MTKKQELFETWVIRNKTTGKYFKAVSGKAAWRKAGHAKNAWINSSEYRDMDIPRVFDESYYGRQPEGRFPKFDEQDIYELVKLKPELDTKLEEAKALLEVCLKAFNEISSLDAYDYMYDVWPKIEAYLEESK